MSGWGPHRLPALSLQQTETKTRDGELGIVSGSPSQSSTAEVSLVFNKSDARVAGYPTQAIYRLSQMCGRPLSRLETTSKRQLPIMRSSLEEESLHHVVLEGVKLGKLAILLHLEELVVGDAAAETRVTLLLEGEEVVQVLSGLTV